MSDEAAFREKIIAEPDDDTHRLVYADWLQEHGQEVRAEFIRAQVALARTPHCGETTPSGIAGGARAGCLWCFTEQRARKLFRGQWDEELGAFAFTNNPAPAWRRGFVESIACTATDWITHGDEVTSAHPVTQVTLTTWPECFHGGDTDSDLDDREEYWLLTPDGTMPADENESGVWFPRGTEPDTPEMVRTLLAARWPGVTFDLPE